MRLLCPLLRGVVTAKTPAVKRFVLHVAALVMLHSFYFLLQLTNYDLWW